MAVCLPLLIRGQARQGGTRDRRDTITGHILEAARVSQGIGLIFPIDCDGGEPLVRLQIIPSVAQKDFQTWEVKCGPLSDTMSHGILCSQKTRRTRSFPVTAADGSLGRGTKSVDLEKLSTIVRMTV